MAIGKSGRVVIDIGPVIKRKLYTALRANEKSLKEWFLKRCDEYLREQGQPNLFRESAVTSARSYETE